MSRLFTWLQRLTKGWKQHKDRIWLKTRKRFLKVTDASRSWMDKGVPLSSRGAILDFQGLKDRT